MILSMTGYGKAEYHFATHKTIVEIRSLNSKQLDLNLKVTPLFRDKEPDIRALLTAPLERGKVDVTIYTVDGGQCTMHGGGGSEQPDKCTMHGGGSEQSDKCTMHGGTSEQPDKCTMHGGGAEQSNKCTMHGGASEQSNKCTMHGGGGAEQPDKCTMHDMTPINKEAFAYYYKELTDLQSSLNMPGNQDMIGAILRIPGVLQQTTTQESVTDEEWGLLQQAINEALSAFRAFRVQEGAALEKMFTEKLDGIAQLLAAVEPYEKNRVATIRQRLIDNLSKISEQKGTIADKKVSVAYDESRLEAELIYYLEKLDITEEKVRLTNHIRYFRETMLHGATVGNATDKATNAVGVGKKLGFIAQEMGREINTLGSKSNQSEMQILDVQMKDILEQIKEQVLNVL